MLAAGLLAKKAVEQGLKVKPYVKTSLAPGSRVVTDYLRQGRARHSRSNSSASTSSATAARPASATAARCPEPVAKAVTEGDLVAAAVLSGNRNFEGRINPLVKANYLASPPLVVAYALAGTTDIDLTTRAAGHGQRRPAGLSEGHLAQRRRRSTRRSAEAVAPEMFRKRYANVFESNETWNAIAVADERAVSPGTPKSTYIQEPPFLVDLTAEPGPIQPIRGARVLAALGDSVTTDHISPAGSIAATQPGRQVSARARRQAGRLQQLRRPPRQRPGDDPRHVRQHPHPQSCWPPAPKGASPGTCPTAKLMTIYDAAMKYKAEGVPLVVLAGAEYGTGSSRDWAAKGTFLLGVRAVHRRRASSGSTAATWSAWASCRWSFPPGKTWRIAGPDRRRDRSTSPASTISFKPRRQTHRSRHGGRRHGQRVHLPRSASTRRSSWNTTATAASCRRCCASCSNKARLEKPFQPGEGLGEGTRPRVGDSPVFAGGAVFVGVVESLTIPVLNLFMPPG